MTDESASEYLPSFLHFEGNVPWPYCDRFGYVTIGIGNLVPTASAMAALPLVHRSGEVATDEDKMKAYDAVKAAFVPAHPERLASAYRMLTDVRLHAADAVALCRRRILGQFLPQLRKVFPGFDAFPVGPRRALVDMLYSMGLGWKPKTKGPDDKGKGLLMFAGMIDAINLNPPSWYAAAIACHRSTCSHERNEWTRIMFESGAAVVATDDEVTTKIKV